MSIPLVDGNEAVHLWHPAVYARVEALCADPRMRGELRVESAGRTYEEQWYLFVNQHKPGFNLAADPRQDLTPAYGLVSAKGSWHMVQPDGFCYAVDFLTAALSPDVRAALPIVAAEYRLVQTVLYNGDRPDPSPLAPLPATPTQPWRVKEWWHFQPPYNEGPLVWTPNDTPAPTPQPPTVEEDPDMAFLIRNKTNKAIALIDAGNFIGVEKDDFPALKAKFGEPIELSSTQFAKFQKGDVD